MKQSNIEELARSVVGEEKSKKLDIKAIGALMDSDEGKALLKTLSGPGGDALKKAAGAASEGDKGAIQRLMMSLMGSSEGQALAKQVMEISRKNP